MKDRGRAKRLETYIDLAKDVRRRVDPLTDIQMTRFRHAPDVRIPEDVVELQLDRFHDAYDFCCTGENLACLVHVPDEHLCLLRIGTCVRELGENTLMCGYRLFGFVGTEPLWMTSTGHGPRSFCKLTLGSVDIVDAYDISCVTILPDMSIAFTHTGEGDMLQYLAHYKDGEVMRRQIDRSRGEILRFVQTADGEVRVIYLNRGRRQYVMSRFDFPLSTTDLVRVDGASILDLYTEPGRHFLCLQNERGEAYLMFWDPERGPVGAPQDIGRTPYLSSARTVSWGPQSTVPDQCGYIGQAAHQRMRWVVDREPRPAFLWVSDIFQHPEHGPCYWGLERNALLTLRV